jgi:hypothetical protein
MTKRDAYWGTFFLTLLSVMLIEYHWPTGVGRLLTGWLIGESAISDSQILRGWDLGSVLRTMGFTLATLGLSRRVIEEQE